MNYYERHIGDYLKDTAHLSLLEHGVYGRLLDLYYTREQPLPEDQVMRLVGARSDEERSAVRDVLNEFFCRDGDVWRHTRCDRELERYRGKQEKARASANARWNKPSSADDMRTHSEGSAEAMLPVTSNQTPDPISNTHPTGVRAPAVAESPDCPHRQVLELWKSILPSVPQHDPELWSGTRAVNLRTRWREVAKAKGWTDVQQGLAWFERLFRYIALSAFLTGRASVGDKRPFLIELEWLVKHANWVKVREGKYHQPDEVPHD